MVYGYPSENVWELDLQRFGALQSSRTFLRHRVMEVMRKCAFTLILLGSAVFVSFDLLVRAFPYLFNNHFELGFSSVPISGRRMGIYAPPDT
jgi:hypothetical protein